MLISKFDLYKPGWLELVFEHRNKAYGAYELRQHHARNMVMAMTLTFLGIGVIFVTATLFRSHHAAGPGIITTVVDLKQLKEETKKVLPTIPKLPKPVQPPATIKFIPPVVRPDKFVTEPPPKLDDLTPAISTTTTKGDITDPGIPTIEESKGDAGLTEDDNKVHTLVEIQVMPMPVGGEEAWTKFLNKNLRFPPEAQADGVGGKVFVGFVIEKDGSLSNISVEKAVGHGFDEEAMRVLKLAKPWKPGIQNGRPVRVKFVIPINFQAAPAE
jgi:periplasmic protein TonB